MAIRLRTVDHNGQKVRVALCAVEADEQPGDIYIDDGDQYALSAKFNRDWLAMGLDKPVVFPEEWAAMDTQKVRDSYEAGLLFDQWRSGDKSEEGLRAIAPLTGIKEEDIHGIWQRWNVPEEEPQLA